MCPGQGGQAQPFSSWPLCGTLHPLERTSGSLPTRQSVAHCGHCVMLGSGGPCGLWLIQPPPWPLALICCSLGPSPSSHAGVKSSADAEKGRRFSFAGPEIALLSPH